MILSSGDLHTRKEEPFFSAVRQTLEEYDKRLKKGDTFVQLGDWFHISRPYPEENALVYYYIQKWTERGVLIIALAGNHDYLGIEDTYSIDPFDSMDVLVIKKPTIMKVETSTFLFLPWMPRSHFPTNQREFYFNSILDSDVEGGFVYENKEALKEVDYICYHFEDETVFMGGINIGYDIRPLEKYTPKAKRIGGHIHIQSKNYIGTPYQTRYDERGQVGRYITIENGVYRENNLPLFIEYVDIEYGEEVDTNGSKILTIVNAPSLDACYQKYNHPNLFIRKVDLIVMQERITEEEESSDDGSLVGMFMNYADVNSVDDKTKKYVLGLL